MERPWLAPSSLPCLEGPGPTLCLPSRILRLPLLLPLLTPPAALTSLTADVILPAGALPPSILPSWARPLALPVLPDTVRLGSEATKILWAVLDLKSQAFEFQCMQCSVHHSFSSPYMKKLNRLLKWLQSKFRKLRTHINLTKLSSRWLRWPRIFFLLVFTDSALWAGLVIESPCPCVCLCVCVKGDKVATIQTCS